MWQNREPRIKSLFLYNHLIFGKSAMQFNEERRTHLLYYAEATKYAHKKQLNLDSLLHTIHKN